jgi:hypothetical protein
MINLGKHANEAATAPSRGTIEVEADGSYLSRLVMLGLAASVGAAGSSRMFPGPSGMLRGTVIEWEYTERRAAPDISGWCDRERGGLGYVLCRWDVGVETLPPEPFVAHLILLVGDDGLRLFGTVEAKHGRYAGTRDVRRINFRGRLHTERAPLQEVSNGDG